MCEIDIKAFFNKTNTSELKERVAPSVDLTESEPNDDVNFRISSDMHDIEPKETLDMPPTNDGELTYADVVRRVNASQK